MSPGDAEPGQARATAAWSWLAIAAILITMVVLLRMEGRIWWCACGGPKPWDGDIWSAHNSQHWLDPYSFTHVLHGVLFYGALTWLWPRVPLVWRVALMVLLESAWEVAENSPFIIQRYREATIGQGYTGDSIANSVADVACCALGFMLARRLGLRWSAVLFVLVEVGLALTVRDNLTLNVLMLIHPVEWIKAWQMVH